MRLRIPVTLEELLLRESMVQPWQLQDARNYQERKGGTLGRALVSLGFLKDEELTTLLSRQYGVPSINLDPFTVDPAILEARPRGDGEDLQGPAALALWRHADRRHGRPDERAGAGRRQAHHRLQRGAGRGVRVGAGGRDRPLLRAGAGRRRCGETPRSPRPARRASGQSGSTSPRCTRPRWAARAAPSAASSRTWRTCGRGSPGSATRRGLGSRSWRPGSPKLRLRGPGQAVRHRARLDQPLDLPLREVDDGHLAAGVAGHVGHAAVRPAPGLPAAPSARRGSARPPSTSGRERPPGSGRGAP